MSRTITALFDSRREAEAARERLTQASIPADDVQIVDQSSTGRSGQEGGGFWASLKEAFMPSEDRHAYAEGVRRGGYLLCAKVDEDRADEACRIVEESGSVDFDGRQESWRSEGWQGYQAAGSAGSGERERGAVEEERIPLVEEQLKVGKREVERGGARVRSYVEERPVSEEINLREENVSVERRSVDRAIDPAELDRGNLLEEREVEMTERAEEPVVEKEARVREEVVLRKTAEERTEQVEDTVRRSDVEVDEGRDRQGSGGSAFGFGDREQAAQERAFDPSERDRG